MRPQSSAELKGLYGALYGREGRRKTVLACDEVVAHPPDKSGDNKFNLGLIVHGLLGTGRNWRTFARSLAKQAATESGR